jgi:hypothetical protein
MVYGGGGARDGLLTMRPLSRGSAGQGYVGSLALGVDAAAGNAEIRGLTG